MKRTLIFVIILFTLVFFVQNTFANKSDSIRAKDITEKLSFLSQNNPSYLKEIDLSVGNISIAEIFRNIANLTEINISAKNVDNIMATCNFSKVKVVDMIHFLCLEYNLELDAIGNIASIYPLAKPEPKPKLPFILYNDSLSRLSYDLNNDNLIDVIKEIGEKTKQNIILPQDLYNNRVFGYVNNMPLDEALMAFASTNNLLLSKNPKNGVWNLSANNEKSPRQAESFNFYNTFSNDQLTIDSLGFITAHIRNCNIQDLITEICNQAGKNRFFISPINEQTSVYVSDVSFETLLDVLFSGTPFSYYKENGIFFFGKKGNELTSVKIISLQNRSVNKLEEVIPQNLKNDIQIKTFPDLNSLIVSGEQRSISRIENFIQSIDIKVPLVTIEVIIVDVTKQSIKEIGVGMGLDSPSKTSGTLSPGVNMNLNAASVNNLINRLNGFGSVNMGKVNSDFYMNLKFLEDNGTIKLQSTPKLSTLNGHEAILKSGEKTYYKEIANSYFGTQNPIQSESYVWKDVTADMIIKITPFVSQNNSITLEIEIEQNEFIELTREDAPPGISTRSFKSMIEVQNEDMVLLGGIEKNTQNKSSSGLPWISHIPGLKHLFGQTTNNKIKNKLAVFIKPTIL